MTLYFKETIDLSYSYILDRSNDYMKWESLNSIIFFLSLKPDTIINDIFNEDISLTMISLYHSDMTKVLFQLCSCIVLYKYIFLSKKNTK